MSDTAAEERVSNGSQYGSIEGTPQSRQATSNDSPPKPAVRQRTLTRQSNKQNQQQQQQQQQQQDLCDGQTKSSSSRKGSNGSNSTTRDELNRELQAELGRKLSLARSRLEQSEQLEREVVKANNDHDPHQHHQQQQQQQQQQQSSKSAGADLSLSMSMEKSAVARRVVAVDDDDDDLPAPTRPYPKKVFFIIANEFCERFSYYGLRTVLVMYLSQVLKFSDSNSTITFHLFATLCYVTPILGAILGDSIWGKFKTIFLLSIVYFLGEFVLMLSAVFWNNGSLSVWTTFAGLFLIGFGTGGIKPCVSALGGDQFMAHEEKWRQSFFSLFYAAINMGSLITVFVTPLLRTEFQCVGRQDCFPLAFGVPCALMFVAIVIFLLAKNQYYLAPLPEENVIVSFCSCIWVALKRKLSGKRPDFVLDDNLAIVAKHQDSSSQDSSDLSTSGGSSSTSTITEDALQSSNTHLAPGTSSQNKQQVGGAAAARHKRDDADSGRRSHWLYLAADRFDSKSIEAFRSVLGILLLFIPTLVYWCLFDQQGSLWTLQATRMDGHIFGGKFVLQPDQMGVANPLILLAIIPLFEVFIYPGLGKCNLLKKPLQRMTMGGFLAAFAFLASAAVEVRIQQFLPPSEPKIGSANLILVNGLRECSVINSTISHIPMPDVLAAAAASPTTALPFITAANINQTTSFSAAATATTTTTTNDFQNKLTTLRLDSLEALAANSVDVQSANSTTLSSYQLRLKLADSQEQIKSNKSFGCPIADRQFEHEFSFAPLPDQATRMLYLELGNGKLTYKLFNESLELPPPNKARVRLLYEFFGSSYLAERRHFSLTLKQATPNPMPAATNNSQDNEAVKRAKFTTLLKDGQVLLSDYVDIEVPSAGGSFSLDSNDAKLSWNGNAVGDGIFLEPGTRNLLIVHQSDANHFWLKHQLLQDNKYRVNMLYQLIPYTLISMSEVMFSITGLEFSYSMAPASMKSVLLAIWSLTIAFGNLLTVFVESLHLFSDVAYEFLFYAGLMTVDMCIFAIMGYNFKPNKYHGQ